MNRRVLLAAASAAPLSYLYPKLSVAQGRQEGVGALIEPLYRKRAHAFCTFEHPPSAGGIVPRAYALKGAGRGKSQMTWSFTGSLPGVPNPVGDLQTAFAAWRAPPAA